MPSTTRNISKNPHKPLRADIKYLGTLLGQVIAKCESPLLLEKVEEIRTLSKKARQGDKKAFARIQNNLSHLSPEDQAAVARAFTEFLRLANAAEQFHRIRRRREYEREGLSAQPGSLAALFERCGPKKAKDLLSRLEKMEIDLVFTAHPTEALRPSAIRYYRQITDFLDLLDQPAPSMMEKENAQKGIERTLFALWNTSLFRDHAPTPFDEVLSGLSIIEDEVWPAIPNLFGRLNHYYEKYLKQPLPLTCTPIRLSSWMGGDRDGNPNVTAVVTRKVLNHCLFRAASLYLKELNLIAREFPFTFRDEALASKYNLQSPEPYRELIGLLISKLENQKRRIEESSPNKDSALSFVHEALVDLHVAISRHQCGPVARGRLEDLIRRIRVFGPALLRLDIRQNRDVHEATVTEILQKDGIAYQKMSDAERFAWLSTRVFSEEFSIRGPDSYSEPTKEVLSTISVMSEYPRECFGLYIISMAESSTDILEVLFLQRCVGIANPLPVAPLFETPDSLAQCEATLKRLYDLPDYRAWIEKQQHVMLGYSDSGKRAGKFASAWTIFNKQLSLTALSDAYGIEPVYFHGRGGSIGRGGGPIALALRGLPRGRQTHKLRITEQGESIHSKFGLPEVALRTFELYISGLLESGVEPPAKKRDSWSALMTEMADASAKAFRGFIYENPNFIEYYTQITPAEELGKLCLGSRPPKRKGLSDFEALRAIPWIFSWTQNRFLIPSWLGVYEALATGLSRGNEATLKDMYDKWPFFASTLDLVEMVLAKVDLPNVQLYSDRLVRKDLQEITRSLMHNYSKTVSLVLRITGHKKLLEHNRVLARSIEVRNPYVQVLNVLQVLMLSAQRSKSEFEKALPITISGISAGMKNTG
ncbi:MAG: phosphoenolpyruvate carboxylase [Bdellovibrionales bacterium]|nr:phosphoenolpyruvate carboxylase [Bdellovibrionales bacterium]